MTDGENQEDGRRDFDFFFGSWRVTHTRLRKRLQDCDEWEEFEGHATAFPILGGLGNIDDNKLELPSGPYRAVSIRKFDTARKMWSIWWLDARQEAIESPVHGRFSGGLGIFEGDDVFNNMPIKVRFEWRNTRTENPEWNQAFSSDGGKTWEENWRMMFCKVPTWDANVRSA